MNPYRRFLDGDVGALVETLLVAIARDEIRAEPGRDPLSPQAVQSKVTTRRWALEAALMYVLHAHGAPVVGIPLPKRGSSGRWTTRILREVADAKVHMAVIAERKAGATLETSIATVSDATGSKEDTIRSAYRRAARRLGEDPMRYVLLGPFVESAAAGSGVIEIP